MTVQDALAFGDIPMLEREVILAHILDCSRTGLLAHPEQELTIDQQQCFKDLVARREKGEPIAYLIGKAEFYGREFIVNASVLIPRPATEGLIDTATTLITEQKEQCAEIDTEIVALSRVLKKWNTQPSLLVDIGTGSGCIAITLGYLFPDANIIATDISDDALQIAERNITKHAMNDRISIRNGNLFAPLKNIEQEFIVITNPPYVAKGKADTAVAEYEPASALYGDTTLLKKLMDAAETHPYCMGIAMECTRDQASEIC